MITEQLDVLAERFGIEVPPELAHELDVPIISGKPQRQGDVFWEPFLAPDPIGLEPIPPSGIPVVRGENGGNTHLLLPTGAWAPASDSRDEVVLGTLRVADDEAAYLWHPEHGMVGFGPGTYVAKRQRTAMQSIRMIED